MKISSIPQIYRNLNRITEILSVLSKYGLADGISRLNLDFAKGLLKNRDGEALARHTRETRIRLALIELGPTFVKLGQILSTRPDLVGNALANELRTLQDQTPADAANVVRQMIQDELGQPVEDLFREFDDQPLASASIGQVHRAVMHSGEEVVLKVQHANIQKTVHRDLDVMSGLAQLFEMVPEFAPYRPVQTLADFQRTLRRELDFGREERNLQQFAARFQSSPYVRIPQPISELCTPRIVTMEYLKGVKVSDVAALQEMGADPELIARRGAEAYLDMIFGDGFFHADPHPGNIVVFPGNKIGLLDFGMVGRIDEQLREDIEDLLVAVVNGDSALLCSMVLRIGDVPPELDERLLRTEVTEFVEHYGSQPLDRFSMGDALSEMTDIIYRHRIALPGQIGMLLKVLVTLEGTARTLCPAFSLMEIIQPYQKKAILRRLSPVRRLKKMRVFYSEVEHLLGILPRRTLELLNQIQAGKFDVHLDHRGLGPSVNRLVLGMLSSALFLGSAMMLCMEVPPLLFPSESIFGLKDMSILGLGGCLLSLLLGIRLLWAIGKSGHLDEKGD